MTATVGSCPSCGANVAFTFERSVVTVCSYCQAAVVRGDRTFESLGKVADLVATGSPLHVNREGRLEGVPFRISGRAQIKHPMGGLWDEWYVSLDDGRTGWLAEAQGRYFLTFEREDVGAPPPYEALRPGAPVSLAGAPFVVGEVGEASYAGAVGEIPFRLIPGARFRYADLSGGLGAFATVDYGGAGGAADPYRGGPADTGPSVYLGREVTLAELGIPVAPAAAGDPDPHALAPGAPAVRGARLACPNCDGNLDLVAPDRTQRVACPYCSALLDVNQGNLVFLKLLGEKAPRLTIPLGAKGTLLGDEYQVAGYLRRSVTYDVTYLWGEYLLYSPKVGFRWLVESDYHWTFVEQVSAGDVTPEASSASYKGRSYELFQSATARVEQVWGQFTWKVEQGETVVATDYVAPPYMLSSEATRTEVTWSHGLYLPVEHVERGFRISGLPRPVTVAPNQPFRHGAVLKLWAVLALALFVVTLAIAALRTGKTVFEGSYVVGASGVQAIGGSSLAAPPGGGATAAGATAPPGQPPPGADGVIFTEPFELESGKNLKVTVSTDVLNTWAFFAGDFVNEATGLVQPFGIGVEYYQGSDAGGTWTEGSRAGSDYVSAVPAGRYVMRLAVERERARGPVAFTVRVQQGVFRWAHFLYALLILSAIPIIVLIMRFSFEKRRRVDNGAEDDDDE